ncbi:MAG: hypothetical protein J0665_13335 [Deltaproteobacteria bacterium]|nr:hypothetical protein [Deltaproteobacteria bacterium]
MSKVAKSVLLRHLIAMAATLPAQSVSYTKMLGQLHDAGNTTTLYDATRLVAKVVQEQRFHGGESVKSSAVVVSNRSNPT